MPNEPWTTAAHLVEVWRPLRPAETSRADGLIAFVERAVRRTWPDVDKWIAEERLAIEDVRDVVVWTVLPLIAPDVDLPLNAKSWQDTSGSESRSVTLDSATGPRVLTFAPWMVRIFESVVGAPPAPSGALPAGGGFGDPGYIGHLFESTMLEGRWRRGSAR